MLLLVCVIELQRLEFQIQMGQAIKEPSVQGDSPQNSREHTALFLPLCDVGAS